MKEHSGIKHIAQMRYITPICSQSKHNFTNTIEYAKKFMKLIISKEELEEERVDHGTKHIIYKGNHPLTI
jgi:hypothetical protein